MGAQGVLAVVEVFFAPRVGWNVYILVVQLPSFGFVDGGFFEGRWFFGGVFWLFFVHLFVLLRLGILTGLVEGGVGIESVEMVEDLEGVAGLSFHEVVDVGDDAEALGALVNIDG